MSETKGKYNQSVGVKSDRKEKNKNTSVAKEAKQRLSAPELPGSMKYMLNDEKDEDAHCVGIQVTFFKKGVQEVKFWVEDLGERSLKSISEYELFKDSKKVQNRELRKNEAAAGWLKKLAIRCMLFPKNLDQDPNFAQKIMQIGPVPKVVSGIMSLTQLEFANKYPNPDSLLDFWKTAIEDEELEEYALRLGVSIKATIHEFVEAREERLRKKTSKMVDKLSHSAKEVVATPVTKPVAPAKVKFQEPPKEGLIPIEGADGNENYLVSETLELFNSTVRPRGKLILLQRGYADFLSASDATALIDDIGLWTNTNPGTKLTKEILEKTFSYAFSATGL